MHQPQLVPVTSLPNGSPHPVRAQLPCGNILTAPANAAVWRRHQPDMEFASYEEDGCADVSISETCMIKKYEGIEGDG